METRDCFICHGSGKIDKYGDDDVTVIGKEDCYQCEGSGELEDMCYCGAWCVCECICDYFSYDEGCHCYDDIGQDLAEEEE